jgi:hypothetical protein
MKTKIWLCIALIMGVIGMRAEELSVETAPPGVADRVAQLVGVGDYAGIAKVSDEIDSQFKGVHDAEYFRNLLGVLAGLHRDKREFSYDRRWAIRKLQWKILLTKHSGTKDAFAILDMKDWLIWVGLTPGGISIYGDNDQLVALRLDAAALLWSYRDCLRDWIIPNYKPKPVRGQMSVAVPNTAAEAQAAARERLLEPILVQNAYDNSEQDKLRESLRNLNHVATILIECDFSWLPEDDATVAKLLDTFPDDSKPRERLLRELDSLRRRYLGEYETLKKHAAAALQQAK